MRHVIVCIGSVKAADYQQLRLKVLEAGGKPKIVRLPDGFLPISQGPSSYGVDLQEVVSRLGCGPDVDIDTLIRELFKRQYGGDFPEKVEAVLIGPDVVCNDFDGLRETLDSVFNYVVTMEPAEIIRIER